MVKTLCMSQHAPPDFRAPISAGGLRNVIKRLPGVARLRRKLWTPQWGRMVMNRHCRELVEGLEPASLEVLEISGQEWGRLYDFKQYTSVQYPDYDVCEKPLDRRFDLIIAEQVFEHLLWPYRTGRNVYGMLRPGGHFLISTPFLVKVHPSPIDCSRWTETGLKHLLAECGFGLDEVQTFSWGNRACVRANFRGWVRYHWWRSLKNEANFPFVVWALVRKVDAT